MTTFAVVMTTVATIDDARAIGRALVEGRLAACVQILPVESIYRWDDKVEDAAERLLFCKIRLDDYVAVEAAIKGQHGYDVPEIVAVPIIRGFAPYLAWAVAETQR